ncbi:MAG: transporter substrate-binding domain-containing protein [Candidatus Cloacimonadales bacterium]|jgi:PAS domain S-box-containing protein|nr:transporter substrate-binding domain-containing protein [Candidatus Cloacimonadales bacterium]
MKKNIFLMLLALCLLSNISYGFTHNSPLTELKIAIDNNYPPYFFNEDNGKYQGILYDKWKKWENKTGIKVIFIAENWEEAIESVKSGEVHVLETAFYTAERAVFLEYGKPYADIKVPVFVKKDLFGINVLEDLKSYVIGVKSGDAVIEFFKASNITGIKEYDTYCDIINAAVSHNINVFSVDEPPALYYLNRMKYNKDYRLAFVLYTGQLHYAVLKENKYLLKLIESGFDLISNEEINDIKGKWHQKEVSTFNFERYKIQVYAISLFLISTVLALLYFSYFLQKRIKSKTNELNDTLEKLMASQQRNEAILQASPNLLFIFNENGDFVDYKASSIEELFVPPNEIIGSNAFKVLPKENAEQLLEIIMLVKATKQVQVHECSFIINNKLEHFLSQMAPLGDKEYLCIVQKITERKQLEEQNLLSKKLASLSQLAGGLAHGFNNIMTTVIGNLSMIKMLTDKDSNISHLADEAIKATNKAQYLTNHLLTFADGGDPVFSIIDINSLIVDTLNFCLKSSNCVVNFDLYQGVTTIKADSGQLSQAIQNIIINACEAMPEGGVIKITSCIRFIGANNVQRLCPGEYLKITICDEGIGVKDDQLEHIYDPYYSTKLGNTGLGITISYSIIKKHHGTIEMIANNQKGTTVNIYLPIVQEEREGIMENSSIEKKPSDKKKYVLLMDDDKQIRFIGKEMLEYMGYNVILSEDGEEAVEILKEYHSKKIKIDYLIMDLTIPGKMGGKEAIKLIREFNDSVYAIVTSGYSTDPVMSNYKEYSFNNVLIKPFDFDMLKDVLK